MVEDEQWAVIEVSPRSQRVSDIIVDSAVKDAPEVVFEKTTNKSAMPVSPEPQSDTPPVANGHTPNGTNPNEGDGDVKSTNAKFIVIEERSFYIVSATMQVLGLVVDYLKVMVNLPSLNMECMSRLVEFLKVCGGLLDALGYMN